MMMRSDTTVTQRRQSRACRAKASGPTPCDFPSRNDQSQTSFSMPSPSCSQQELEDELRQLLCFLN